MSNSVGASEGFDAHHPRSIFVALDPRQNDTSNFSPISALILFVAFVGLVIAAGYLGHMMAGE